MAAGAEIRWVARLRATQDSGVEGLLGLPLGLDVWERRDDELVVAATERQLSEIERRCLASVVRLRPASAATEDER